MKRCRNRCYISLCMSRVKSLHSFFQVLRINNFTFLIVHVPFNGNENLLESSPNLNGHRNSL